MYLSRQCNKCSDVKIIEDFHFCSKSRDGFMLICKKCVYLRCREYKDRPEIRVKRAAKEKAYNKSQESNADHRFRRAVSWAKNRRKEDFEIDSAYVSELWDRQDGKCALSGQPLKVEPFHLTTVSIDRIDSSLPYLKSNVQLVGSAINRMKNSHDTSDFIALCASVTDHMRSTPKLI